MRGRVVVMYASVYYRDVKATLPPSPRQQGECSHNKIKSMSNLEEPFLFSFILPQQTNEIEHQDDTSS